MALQTKTGQEELLVREPDNKWVDETLWSYGVDPAKVQELDEMDPKDVPSDGWTFGEGARWSGGVLGRPRRMTYYYGPGKALGNAVKNDTPKTIKRHVGGKKTVGAETTIGIQASLEAEFYGVVKTSVSTSFSQTWKQEEEFEDYLDVDIDPGHMSWLELQPVIREIEGDFIFLCWWNFAHQLVKAARFSGTVTAPGLEGDLHNVLTVRDTPVSQEEGEALRGAASQPPTSSPFVYSDGAVILPAWLADAQWGKDASRASADR
ncbi:hypothetical protein ACOBQB_10325 [Streptomyces sp. G5(2025)]|uniref:hypothetical protein n=1 Tax=Streptomyces sp. G5(2025) TaxID=3406628 RepID=UPI003C13944F